MDTKIIGQGYNLDADTSVAKELIEQFTRVLAQFFHS